MIYTYEHEPSKTFKFDYTEDDGSTGVLEEAICESYAEKIEGTSNMLL